MGAVAATGVDVPPHPSSCPAARGLESIELPPMPTASGDGAAASRAALAGADASFQESDLLKELKEKSEANRDKNRKAIEGKYCLRQAELGIGDCGGLKLIPGATTGGKQKTPGWIAKLLGKEAEIEAYNESPEAAAAAAAGRDLIDASK